MSSLLQNLWFLNLLASMVADMQCRSSSAKFTGLLTEPLTSSLTSSEPKNHDQRSTESQDTFDHDGGQKSAITGSCHHWIIFELSPVDVFFLSSRFSVYVHKKVSPKCGENCLISSRRKGPVTSLAVMILSVPKKSDM